MRLKETGSVKFSCDSGTKRLWFFPKSLGKTGLSACSIPPPSRRDTAVKCARYGAVHEVTRYIASFRGQWYTELEKRTRFARIKGGVG